MHPDPQALPFVDRHEVEVLASPEAVWESLCRVADRSFSAPAASRIARLVGCESVEASGPRPLAVGASFPGFTVAIAEVGSDLALAGRHRYSEYALVFHLAGDEATTRLRAETRARFPGVLGSVYCAAVIGTRGHVLVTKRLLAAVKRRAER